MNPQVCSPALPATPPDVVLPMASSAGSGAHLLPERVRLLAEQSAGAAGATVLGALLIAAVLADDLGALPVAAWVGTYLIVSGWRLYLSRQILQRRRSADARALRHYLGLAVFNGAWAGALPFAFFSALSIEARVALTVVILLFLTAGASTYASYRTGYLWVLGLALPQLVFDWAVYGGHGAWIVGVTLVLFGLLMVRLSHHLAEVFERSVSIRFEREQVVEQLRAEKRQTELAWQKAEEANRAKSRFLANASHDLRQPAHALGLFTGVLEETAQTQQHRDIARNIALASKLLGELLDNLLDISRLDAGIVSVAPQAVAVQAMMQRLRADTERLVGRRPIAITTSADEVVAWLDPVLVERALRNLLDNALKFTTEGQIHLSARVQGEWLEMCVKDTGCGIAHDQHERVFEEFYQIGNSERDHRKGLGLGLSIVARLATLMAGRVSMESEPGRGTAFWLRLPLHIASAESEPGTGRFPERIDLKGWRVLVIDDEVLVRAGMGELLTLWGAVVDGADGLQQALALLPQNNPTPWHLCLCDLRLRNGEDGVDSALALRYLFPRLPIMLITGDTAPRRIEQAAGSGLPLLHKPVSPVQLARAIRALPAA